MRRAVMANNTRLAVLAAVGMAVLLGGCSQEPVPKDAFYRLEVAPPASPLTAKARFDGAVEIRPFAADGLLSQRAIVFSQQGGPSPADSPLEQYSYHFWAEAPPQALQMSLTSSLRNSGIFQTVVTPELRVMVDYEVQGRLVHFDHLRTATSAAMDVEMELGLTQRKGLRLLHLKVYHVRQEARDGSVQAAAEAAREALQKIFSQFESDLMQLDSSKSTEQSGHGKTVR